MYAGIKKPARGGLFPNELLYLHCTIYRRFSSTQVSLGTFFLCATVIASDLAVNRLQFVRLSTRLTEQSDNLVILTKGADIEKVGTAANNMARTPAGEKKHFIPESERKLILHHTKLLKEHQQQTLRFTAPKKPGKYPYVCTFPGHWTVMKGVMIVE